MFTTDITKRRDKILKPLAKIKDKLSALNADINDEMVEIDLENHDLLEQIDENEKRKVILNQNSVDIAAQINRFNNLL